MEINHKWAWTLLCPYIQASLLLIKPYRYTIVKDLPFRDNYMNRIFMIKMKQVFHHFLLPALFPFGLLNRFYHCLLSATQKFLFLYSQKFSFRSAPIKTAHL